MSARSKCLSRRAVQHHNFDIAVSLSLLSHTQCPRLTLGTCNVCGGAFVEVLEDDVPLGAESQARVALTRTRTDGVDAVEFENSILQALQMVAQHFNMNNNGNANNNNNGNNNNNNNANINNNNANNNNNNPNVNINLANNPLQAITQLLLQGPNGHLVAK